MKVTVFKDLYQKDNPYHVDVKTALNRIKTGASKERINSVRGGDLNSKTKLPAILFSGVFSSRSDAALLEHNGLIVLDFDNVDADGSKSVVGTDPYVYACWVSPSGKGLKILSKITNPEKHRDHFRALAAYFEKHYGLRADETGINESRACFESYDEDIVINEESQSFGGLISEQQLDKQQIVNKNEGYTDYLKLNLAALMIRQAKDGEKHATLLRAARLCGGYIASGRMEEEEVIRILIREIEKKDVDSIAHAMNTIRDGIEEGKKTPISDIINDEKSIRRQMQINDGDMSFISSDDMDYKLITDFADGNIQLGLDTGSDKMDRYFRYKREFVIINGHSNVGKTTMALYLMVNASVRHGWKWFVYSSENTTWSVKMTIMEFATNKRINEMDYNQRKLAFKWVNDHFVVVNNTQVYSYSDLILFMEKTMNHRKLDAAFIDPYNSLRIDLKANGIGVHDYHYEAASEFLTFSKANDVAVWLNMHAVTEAQRRKGDDGLPVAPYAEDTEGGGKFVNRSDCFITIHRKIQSPDPNGRKTTEIHIRKVREVKTGGSPTPIDDPVLLVINSSYTAFRSVDNSKELFEPITNAFDVYEDFNKMKPNNSFLDN